MQVLVFALLLAAAAAFPVNCPANFTYDADLNGCYSIYLQSVNFNSLEYSCSSSGGSLISVHNAFENSKLVQIMLNYGMYNTFLGVTRDSPASQFYNLDGTPFVYSKWAPGQPLNSNCVEMGTDGYWYTTECTSFMQGICMIRTAAPTVAPTRQCPAGWSYLAYNDYCYWIGYNATFYDAIQSCVNVGGSLASVHSAKENNFIVGLAFTRTTSCGSGYFDDVWLGGLVNSDGWKWLDGTPNDYSWFYYQSPKHGSISLTADNSCSDFSKWRGRDASQKIQMHACKRPAGI